MLLYSVLALMSTTAYAWLPQDRDLAAFNASRFDSLDKRFKPTLPNGVSKIRGTNFGGRSNVPIHAYTKVNNKTHRGYRLAYLRTMDDEQ